MLDRVTQGYMVNDFNSQLRQRQSELQKTQNQLSSGLRVNSPSEDPVAIMDFMDYESKLKEINTYKTVVDNTSSKLKTIDSTLDSSTSILQKLRELAVQGANGTLTKDEPGIMAVEVDQMLRELLSQANSQYKGDPVFGGTSMDKEPFKPVFKTNPQTGIEFLENVKYTGNNQAQIIEVDRGSRVNSSQPGNQIFWSDDMIISSNLDVAGYAAPNDSRINIDGIDISIRQGDNLEVIADKINQSGGALSASIETKNGQSYMTIQTTSPHQLSMMDLDGGSTLQDLGLIDDGVSSPNNYAPSARVYTGSIFDVMVNFRKALQDDNVFQIGGTALGGIDNSISNLLKFRANLGAVSERLEIINQRFLSDEVYYNEAKDNAVGTDIPRTMTKMKMLEFSHDVALNIGARILPKTLLDFLR